MKRSGIRRKAPMSRAPLTTGRRKPLRASGETKRKKRARYAAYLRTKTWKAKRIEALERAKYRCEYASAPVRLPLRFERCPVTKDLQVHHKTYARFGNELPEDLIVLCEQHHDFVERTQFPHRRRSA